MSWGDCPVTVFVTKAVGNGLYILITTLRSTKPYALVALTRSLAMAERPRDA